VTLARYSAFSALTSSNNNLELLYYTAFIFQEYEKQLTNESKFVKDLDRFDMILQAFEYEVADNRPQQLQEFFSCCEGDLLQYTIFLLIVFCCLCRYVVFSNCCIWLKLLYFVDLLCNLCVLKRKLPLIDALETTHLITQIEARRFHPFVMR